jgi:hypothetical protein
MREVVDKLEPDAHEPAERDVLDNDVMADTDSARADSDGEDDFGVCPVGCTAHGQFGHVVRSEAELLVFFLYIPFSLLARLRK